MITDLDGPLVSAIPYQYRYRINLIIMYQLSISNQHAKKYCALVLTWHECQVSCPLLIVNTLEWDSNLRFIMGYRHDPWHKFFLFEMFLIFLKILLIPLSFTLVVEVRSLFLNSFPDYMETFQDLPRTCFRVTNTAERKHFCHKRCCQTAQTTRKHINTEIT